MSSSEWDRRIRRASELKSLYPYASEILTFYEHVAPLQKEIHQMLQIERVGVTVPLHSEQWRKQFETFPLLPRWGPFLDAIQAHAPAPLAACARQLRTEDEAVWRQRMAGFCSLEPDGFQAPQELIIWVFLQPFAEYLAEHAALALPDETPSVCPRCRSKPVVGVLRPEGEGAKRSLVCSFCATEWNYRRIVCPHCGEEDVNKLAVYSAQAIAHVRVEACDTCRRYIKTVDLAKDGRAVPIIDELATIPLNLWAAENGYRKSRANLLGL
jgi:formate dehydrogenase accessory protein FdhE